MLIHLNASHTRAIVLSIPRDLIVSRPACRERVGGDAVISGSADAMFDSAMNLGGPPCAVATVQDMSGMRIDHFIRLDFNGFRTMTTVLGGVQVCVPRPGIHDWRSNLNISAGLHTITGNEALAFVRDRHAIGNGGDLGRIQMQQMFVSSLLRKVLSAGTLTNPMMMYRLANVATGALTTDPGLGSVQSLLSLGESLKGLQLGNITFLTLPNETDPVNVDRLIPLEPQAAAVWQLLRSDQPWTGRLPGAGTGGSGVTRQLAEVGSSGDPAPGVQTRNASADICSGLPTPNRLGELGQRGRRRGHQRG
jgi:LCP family protein required for cell wall assembly